MIKKITMPDFIFAKSRVHKLIEQSYNIAYADAAKIAKERLDKSEDFRGGNLKELQPITRQVRRLRGRAGSRPLVDTGSLKNSIKLVKEKGRMGLTFNKYGIYHNEGYETSPKSMIPNKLVPARPFIFPSDKETQKIERNLIIEFYRAMRRNTIIK